MIALAFKRSGRVLLAYGAFTAWGLVCLLVSALLILDEQALPVIASSAFLSLLGIAGATIAGHLVGNLVALLRLRLWVLAVLTGAGAVALAIGMATLGPVGGFLVVGALAAAGGYFGVASRMEIFAAWLPLTYAVGAAVMWMNSHGKVSVWLTGAKFAVWDAVTFGFLSGAVFLFLAFLMTRHALALTLWRDAARPGASTSALSSLGVDALHAKAGRGSLAVLLVLTGVILVTTALLSPFLFRTEVIHGQGNGQTTSSPRYTTTYSHKPPPPSYGSYGSYGTAAPPAVPPAPPAPTHAKKCLPVNDALGALVPGANDCDGTVVYGDEAKLAWENGSRGYGNGSTSLAPAAPIAAPAPIHDGTDVGDVDHAGSIPQPDMDRAAKDGVAAARIGLGVVAWLVVLLGLLLGLAVFFRPLRRAVLLRHLERPLWQTTPTRRVENLWLRALVVLDDLGVHVRSDETPEQLARRASNELAEHLGETPAGIDAAAQIVERVEYAGRGLSPDEEERMRAAVHALLRYASRHIGFMKKLALAWTTVRIR